jgi:hypothetical protein
LTNDSFGTFPFIAEVSRFGDIGERYYAHWQRIMQGRQKGLTQTYNRFHNPDDLAEEIERLR